MQVFISENNFTKCAQVLDTKRLVKQLLEGRQIMTILANESPGGAWKNHPAVKMFAGYEGMLYNYLVAIRDEMKSRGYKWEKNWEVIQDTYTRNFNNPDVRDKPHWMKDNVLFNRLIMTHRGRLWEKDSIHYAQYAPEGAMFMDYVCCPNKCTYYWPTHLSELVV